MDKEVLVKLLRDMEEASKNLNSSLNNLENYKRNLYYGMKVNDSIYKTNEIDELKIRIEDNIKMINDVIINEIKNKLENE